ncbi:hypothetical protein H5P35_03935 [Mycobacterium haemophilum DSM 44634]|nr:hypothetical protein [Mycobacterium haemophilum DSM 44634]
MSDTAAGHLAMHAQKYQGTIAAAAILDRFSEALSTTRLRIRPPMSTRQNLRLI